MKKIYIFLLLVIGVLGSVFSQDRMMTHMTSIPQAIENNPSITVPYKFYLGFPGFSSFNMSFQNPFAYNDIIKRRSDDSLYVDQQGFINNFAKNNLMAIDLKINLIDFGFRVKKNFFTFTQSVRSQFYFSYPKDLFVLLLNGNVSFMEADKTVEFKKLRINSSVYTETAIGFQRNLTNKINIGARLKYLQGFANVQTDNSYFSLYTNPDNYNLTIKSEFGVNVSSIVNANGDVEVGSFTKNPGIALDLGGTYRFSDELAVGASLIDFGFIRWRTNNQQFGSSMVNEEFVFRGFDLDRLFQNGRINSNIMKEIADTLKEQFTFIDTTGVAYTSWLSPKICFDASYIYKNNNKFGAYLRNDIANGMLIPSITISYQRKFGRILQLGASYGMTKGHWAKLGIGMSLKLGPLHGFITTENILSYTNLANLKNMYIHFGTNIVIGKWREALLDSNKSSIDF